MIAVTTNVQLRQVTRTDVLVGGLTDDPDTAESLVGDLVEERHDRIEAGTPWRGWYRRQMIGVVGRLTGRALRKAPFGVIGSVVLGFSASLLTSLLVLVAVVSGEALIASTGFVVGSPVPSWLLSLVTNVVLGTAAGALSGVVAAATHRAAPLVPALVLAALSLVVPAGFTIAELLGVNPATGGDTVGAAAADAIEQVLAAAAIVVGGWWFVRRRATRR